MKTPALLALIALIFTASARAQVPQLVNYQGRVAVGSVNFDGAGQFKFALVNAAGTTTYWSNNGSSVAGNQPTAAVALAVTKGLYSVLLGDTTLTNMTVIPASVFSNADLRLRVWFNDGTNGSQLLAPDQRLAPAAYLSDGAVTSTKLANGAVGSTQLATGAVGAAQLAANAVVAGSIAAGQVVKSVNGLADAVTLAAGANVTLTPSGNTLTIVAAGGAGSLTHNTTLSGIGTAASPLSVAAPLSLGGALPFNSGILTLNNSGDGYGLSGVSATGIGVQGNGSIGVLGLTSSATGYGVEGYDFSNSTFGTAVYGNSALGVAIYGYSPSGFGVYGKTDTGRAGVYGITSSVGPTHAGVFGENSTAGGTAVVGNALAVNSAGVAGVADFTGSTGVYGRAGSNGVYGESGTGVGVYGYGSNGTNGSGVIGYSHNSSNSGAGVYALNDNGGFGILVHSDQNVGTGIYASGGLFAGYFSGNIGVTGNARVGTLTINGGADLAEPFPMSTKDVPKGTVMVIDDENAGRLKPSTRNYDTRVAGIVSGARGVNPGITLHQEGMLEGGQNVALSGRVYVLADAAGGSINPGDLLTTSDTPGHAMKVTDHAKAQGAIIGKAMSALAEGTGMVLVLVSLQ